MSDQHSPTLWLVQKYIECGLWPFPLLPNSKLPVKEFFRANINEAETLKIFQEVPGYGIGLYMGHEYTGHFALDFDTPEAYEAWRVKNPQFKHTAPVAKTYKGYHVLFLGKGFDPLQEDQLNFCATPSSGRGPEVSVISDGWYIAVSPTIHPISMAPYVWTRVPWAGIPTVDFEKEIRPTLDTSQIEWDVEDYDTHYCGESGESFCICYETGS